ncbi:two-component sensor histidine kinase [Actinoplanes capillaceus]|uniref:histidine kinase n=1 Tax=Actinoplanes campanulatus TaxID=113559 RepID=A0ABQ3WX11_9ACTN|nr:histidine kinase [Actinoplanes capillaceus]GID50738.1 two-component sensor histidine kinase [Actinoplanes capillaceus]
MREVLWTPRPTPPPPERVRRDWLLVAVLIPAVIVESVVRSSPVGALVGIAVVPLLLWRRQRPLLMLAINFGVCTVEPFLTGSSSFLTLAAALLLLPYALFRWGSGREIVAGSLIIAGRLAIGYGFAQLTEADVLAGLIILFGIGALGLAMRFRARARLRERQHLRMLERERLARDLHDTVAHHVSAMAIRAQAGQATAETDPASAVEALRLIESEASKALASMRSMVRVLREPGIGDVRALAGPSTVGPPVEVRLDGDVDDLSPAVAATLFRLTQESVTNARRHARNATRIEVRVTADETSVRLEVSDDGEHGGLSSGYGVSGMVERAGLLGGTCQAGPDPDRGWSVNAVLPRAAA